MISDQRVMKVSRTLTRRDLIAYLGGASTPQPQWSPHQRNEKGFPVRWPCTSHPWWSYKSYKIEFSTDNLFRKLTRKPQSIHHSLSNTKRRTRRPLSVPWRPDWTEPDRSCIMWHPNLRRGAYVFSHIWSTPLGMENFGNQLVDVTL